MGRVQNLVGQRFGRLVVKALAGFDPQNRAIWACVCDCGKEHVVRASSLKRGLTKSCGCLADEMRRRRCGPKSPHWKGGKTTNAQGYKKLMSKGHPRADRDGYVFEHHLVMEGRIGRYLLPHEEVHHKNGVRDDNRIENLELWSTHQPPGQRVADKVAWAKQILAEYQEGFCG